MLSRLRRYNELVLAAPSKQMWVEAWLIRQNQRPARAQIQILDIHLVLIEWRKIVHGRKGITWRRSQLQNRIAIILATIVDVELSISGNDVQENLGGLRPASHPPARCRRGFRSGW